MREREETKVRDKEGGEKAKMAAHVSSVSFVRLRGGVVEVEVERLRDGAEDIWISLLGDEGSSIGDFERRRRRESELEAMC